MDRVATRVAGENGERVNNPVANFAIAQIAKNGEVVVAHTGNVRAYIRNENGELRQINADNTSAQELVEAKTREKAMQAIQVGVDAGYLSPDEVRAALRLWEHFYKDATDGNRASRQRTFALFMDAIDQVHTQKDSRSFRIPSIATRSADENARSRQWGAESSTVIIEAMQKLQNIQRSNIENPNDVGLVKYTRAILSKGDVEIIIVSDGVHQNMKKADMEDELSTFGTAGQRANRLLSASRYENIQGKKERSIKPATDEDRAIAILSIDADIPRTKAQQQKAVDPRNPNKVVVRPIERAPIPVRAEVQPKFIPLEYGGGCIPKSGSQVSEDKIMYAKDQRFAVLGDGVGGGNGMSSLASETLMREFANAIPRRMSTINEALTAVRGAVDAAAGQIRNLKTQFNNLHVDTTLATVVRTDEGRDLIAWIGDSRVYVRRPDGLHLLTQDQTTLFMITRAGNQQQLERTLWEATAGSTAESRRNDYSLLSTFVSYFKGSPANNGVFDYNLVAMRQFFDRLQDVKTEEDLQRLQLPVLPGYTAENLAIWNQWFKDKNIYALLQSGANNILTAGVGRNGSGALFINAYTPTPEDIEYVIVSDGITDNLADNEMNAELAVPATTMQRATRLATAATNPDNARRGNKRLRRKNDDRGVVIVPIQEQMAA
jgi:serine/threonine protein phosphatase PrpC